MGTSERRKREKERKEQEIIDAARELFFKKGYTATSMDEIAAKVELSKGAVYLQFPSKEEVYYAVVKGGMAIIRDDFLVAQKRGKGLAQLEAIGKAYIDFWTERSDYRRLMHENIGGTNPLESGPQGRAYAQLAGECNEIMVRSIKNGIEDGSIRPDIQPERFAFCLSSMTDGILARTESKGWSGRDDRFREEMLSYATQIMRDMASAGCVKK
ncbi:MAG: DNA-binding transcriptional repressor AcrR [Methanomassiliicoccales archaeon PtaU1.Bin124]|nr:MAG: DNA-binding transcriptional repressor AcrR [Methanomassiliicoccales archaeon PtaU1.Bin124]